MHINIYMWKLKKWYRLCYLQSRSRDIDVENKHMDIKGMGDRMNLKIISSFYVLFCFEGKIQTSENLSFVGPM